VALLLLTFAEPVARLFVREPEALAAATAWVRVYAVAVVIRAVYGVLRGSLQGAGETRAPLVASAIGLVGFTVGFSWLVGVVAGLGIGAVYAGIVLDAAVRAGILGRVWQRGRWLRSRVTGPAPEEAADADRSAVR
jgi:MATE family multidrug resistance protein